jgi:uncharacterized protein YjbJ (UPF0337 family)
MSAGGGRFAAACRRRMDIRLRLSSRMADARNELPVSVVDLAIVNQQHVRSNVNKERIEGSAEQAKGKVKEVAGKATGDAKLESEGKIDQATGKIKNTVGGVKDAVKEAVDD